MISLAPFRQLGIGTSSVSVLDSVFVPFMSRFSFTIEDQGFLTNNSKEIAAKAYAPQQLLSRFLGLTEIGQDPSGIFAGRPTEKMSCFIS